MLNAIKDTANYMISYAPNSIYKIARFIPAIFARQLIKTMEKTDESAAAADVSLMQREDDFSEVVYTENRFQHLTLEEAILMLSSVENMQAMLSIGLSDFLANKDFSRLISSQTIFMHAAGSPEVLEMLLAIDPKKSAYYLNIQDSAGYTAMHSAACAGRLPSLELMYEKGADLNIENNEGKTPALLAIQDSKFPHRNYAAILHFLARHTDLSLQRDIQGRGILEYLSAKEPVIRFHLMSPLVIDCCIKNENNMREIINRIVTSSRNVVGNHAITL